MFRAGILFCAALLIVLDLGVSEKSNLSALAGVPGLKGNGPFGKGPFGKGKGKGPFGKGKGNPARFRQRHLIYLPLDYESKDAWPLLLFLHGSAERGADLNLLKKHGPPKLIASGRQFPFMVISPQCQSNRWWQPSELTALLDEIVKKYKVDKDRIYVTGFSMGGYGTWSLAAYAPHRFAAIVPICGGGESYWARRISHLPVWAFHGAKDRTVPLARSQKMVNALKRIRGNVKFTVYPNAGHDSWTDTYSNPDLYKWLLEQKRSKQ